MRTLLICCLLVFSISCANKGKSDTQTTITNSPSITYNFKISGMTCTGCEETIQSSVGKIEGVKSVKAFHKTGEALVEFNPELTDSTSIKLNINSTGYTVIGIHSSQNNLMK